MGSAMFAVLTFERDPMQLQDVPAQLLYWVQTAGGWAAFGVFAWLLVGYTRMRAVDRARIVPWHKSIFLIGAVAAAVSYLPVLVLWGYAFLASLFSGKEIVFSSAVQRFVGICQLVGGAGGLVAAGLPFVVSLSTLRFRRIWALTKLTFKEAIRNRVLYGFSALLLVFLFGSWFIPHKPEDQVRSYVAVVYWVMKILLLLAAVILAAFSIPNDIRHQTIHTIITKPVERFEILMGRFLGFTALMTLVLLFMASVSVVYVLRGIDPEAAAESLKAREPLYGVLHFENTGDDKKGTNVGREWDYRGYITAASPNQEPQAAIWDFDGVPRSLADRQTVRCEFAFDIFRQTKGFENRGVSCTFEFQTGNFTKSDKDSYNTDHSRWRNKGNVFSQKDIDDWLAGHRARLMANPNRPSEADMNERLEKQRARLTANKIDSPDGTPQYRLSDAAIDDELAKEYGYYVVPAKDVTDYHTLYVDVPAGLFLNAIQTPAGAAPQVRTRISVTKQSATQYVGMAKYDLYWRLDDPHRGSEQAAFALNFYKGAFGLWLRLCLVIGLAVALSTYLSGVISLLVAGILYLLGGAITYIQSIGQGTAPGGGPMEALVRLANRQVALVPLEETTAAKLATTTDVGFRWFIRRVLDLIPDVDRYDLSAYVAEGFNISIAQLLLDFGTLSLYLLPWVILAYYLIKWREIAAPT
jgi:ABC-type transport system involved in multi-copper enzyme maturation permease subunit